MCLRRDRDDGVEGQVTESANCSSTPAGRPSRRRRGGPDEALLGDRRVEDAIRAELLVEPLCDAERTTEKADVLPEAEDALVVAHGVPERSPNRLEVRDHAA